MRSVILLARPTGTDPVWWAKDDSGEHQWAAVDPYEPPGWSLSFDEDFVFDSVDLFEQLRCTVEEHVEALKEEWNEEYGVDDDGEGATWEFILRELNEAGEFVI